MESKDAVTALSALAQETRLEIFRALVKAGPSGLTAGSLAGALDIAPATLSFHLKELRTAGLALCTRAGRQRIYSPDFTRTQALIDFLTEKCCQGFPNAEGACVPDCAPPNPEMKAE